MASYNRVIFIGRVGRDPETRTFANGGKVCSFSLAVDEKKKNQAAGQYDKTTMWLEISVFNNGTYGKLADIAEQYIRKGSLLHVEGKLKIDEWQDKTTGQKRTRPKIIADSFQLLGDKPASGSTGQQAAGAGYRQQEAPPQDPPQGRGDAYEQPADRPYDGGDSDAGSDIPF